MMSKHTLVFLYILYRVWRPGPEDGRSNILGNWNRVYLEFGFVFIQDMVERALLEEIVAGGWLCGIIKH